MTAINIVKPNTISRALTFLSYAILLVMIGLLCFPGTSSANLIFKILFVAIVVLGLVRMFAPSFSVIGELMCSFDRVKIVMSRASEVEISKVERMTIMINSYVGKPAGLSLRTHDGTDNKMELVIEGQVFTFLFQLQSRQQLNTFENVVNGWTSINKNIVVKRSVI